MEIFLTIVIAALAGGCGYLGGRWHSTHKLAQAQAKLESDTENYLAMLEERNQDYVRQKEQITKARAQGSDAQIELKQVNAQIEQEQHKTAALKQQIDERDEKIERMKTRYHEMEEHRAQYRDAKLQLEAQAKQLQEQNRELRNRNEHIEERFNTALIDKTRLQSDITAKERELQEIRQRLIKQEDLNESTELTLSQLRIKQEELIQQLAHAEGQLSVLEAPNAQTA